MVVLVQEKKSDNFGEKPWSKDDTNNNLSTVVILGPGLKVHGR